MTITSPFFDFSNEDGFHRGFLAFKNAGFSGKKAAFLAADLGHATIGSEVAAHDDEVAVFFERLVERGDDFLAFRIQFETGQILFECFSCDGEAVAVEESGLEELLHHGHDAADFHELAHEEASAGFEVGQHGHAFSDAGEIIKRQFDVGGVGNGEKVKYGVGRTAEGDDDGDGVFDGLAGENVRGADTALEHVENGRAGLVTIAHLVLRHCCLRGTIRQAEAHGFDGGGHCVGGIHSAAGAGAGDGTGFHLLHFFYADFPRGFRADRFKNRNDVEVASIEAAGENGAAVHEDGRPVEPRHGHATGGHIFVAAADGDEPVEALTAHHGLDRIGDDLAGNERVFHPFGAHGYPIGNGDRVEDDGFATRRIDAQSRFTRELVNVHIAGRDHAPGRSDADL